MTAPAAVTDATFADEVLASDTPVLVDFWAVWCSPCRMIAPILEQVAEEQDGRLKIVKLDVDANHRIPHQYGVQGIPTLLVFKSGEPVDRIVGFLPKPSLMARLQKHL